MGVDFFPCDYCGESICDCGSYERCNEHCYRRWCDLECAKQDGHNIDDEGWDSCNFCRKEDAEDGELLQYLLKKYGLTREEVVRELYLPKPKQK